MRATNSEVGEGGHEKLLTSKNSDRDRNVGLGNDDMTSEVMETTAV